MYSYCHQGRIFAQGKKSRRVKGSCHDSKFKWSLRYSIPFEMTKKCLDLEYSIIM